VEPVAQTVVGTLPKTLDNLPGKEIFKTKGCTGCHTLKDAGATGTVGPNLDEKKPPLALVIDRVTNGKRAMPSFKGQLTPAQIKEVAQYVVAATHQS
jgi:mono/diheme cytochrome c family protein